MRNDITPRIVAHRQLIMYRRVTETAHRIMDDSGKAFLIFDVRWRNPVPELDLSEELETPWRVGPDRGLWFDAFPVA